MRSLKRNSWPKDELGNLKKPKRYSDFLPDLIENFGHYCCYCEWPVRKLDVEHVIPKSKRPELECEWTNLLLACPTCNRDYKKNKNDSRDSYVWPDEDDTFAMYRYQPDGQVVINESISAADKVRAENTLTLLNLNPVNDCNDDLCVKRREIWDIASALLDDYEQGLIKTDRIVHNAVANGYWSIWMTVFHPHPEITSKLAAAFPGTLPKYN